MKYSNGEITEEEYYRKKEEFNTEVVVLNTVQLRNYIKLQGEIIQIKLQRNRTDKATTITLAHELGHAHFIIFNINDAWKWLTGNLGEKVPKDNNGDRLYINGEPMGEGHDMYNPNGKAAEESESNCKNGYNDAKNSLN